MVTIECPCITDAYWLSPFRNQRINIMIYDHGTHEVFLRIQAAAVDACYSQIWRDIEEHVPDPPREDSPKIQFRLYAVKDNAVYQRNNDEHLPFVVDAVYHDGCQYATLIIELLPGTSA